MTLPRPVVVAVAALSLAAGLLVSSPAHADGPHDDPVSVDATVAAGGTQMLTSQTLPKDSKAIKVTVKPRGPSAAEDDVYDHFTHSLGTLSKQGRLLVCTMMYQKIVTLGSDYSDTVEINAQYVSIAGAVLIACLQMAGLLESRALGRAPTQDRMAQASARRAATSKCGQLRPSVASTVEETDEGWSVTASGTTKKAKRPKLKVGCTQKGNRITYKVRPAKKGVPLRKVVGKRFMVGIKSPADASTSVPVRVTFDPL